MAIDFEACEGISQPQDRHQTEQAGALYTFISPVPLLTPAEQDMTNVVSFAAYSSVNGEATDPTLTFGIDGYTMEIRRQGVYHIETFAEFTTPTEQQEYYGTRTYSVAGPNYTRRLWQPKFEGVMPELAGSVSGTLIVPPGVTSRLRVAMFLRIQAGASISRVFSQVLIRRLADLSTGQFII